MSLRTHVLAAGGLALLLGTTALAQKPGSDARWTSGMGQGVMEAEIRSPDRSAIGFSCSVGQERPATGLGVEIRGTLPRGIVNLRLVVDGRAFPLLIENGVGQGVGPMRNAIKAAADALVASRARVFVAEIPDLGWRQEFSLAGVREALGERPGRTILDECG